MSARKAKPPVWSDEEISRLLGARDGLAQGLCAVEAEIGHYDGPYRGRFHPRHTRKIAERDAITAPLKRLAKQLREDYRACQLAYDRQFKRAQDAKSSPLSSNKGNTE
ncbi:hypothetical protein ABIB94_007047 [Bradyrhizobium sp. JR7.2]|uniref:hypothetical protein n=1 Tax=Bradyrhizobium sp. JR7.2 TaxID=3156375 RepID=UPI003399F1BD